MRAAIADQYGPPQVVRLADVEKLTPRANEILVRVRATTVSAGDIRLRAFSVPLIFWLPFRFEIGLFRPKNPSSVLSLPVT